MILLSGYCIEKALYKGTVMATSPMAESLITSMCFVLVIVSMTIFYFYTKQCILRQKQKVKKCYAKSYFFSPGPINIGNVVVPSRK